MKLLTKTALVYITATLLLFLGGGIIFYFQLKSVVDEEVTENLVAEKQKVQEYFKLHGTLPENQVLYHGQINTDDFKPGTEYIHDTLIYDNAEEEFLEYKVIAFPLKNDTSAINVLLSAPSFESDDLIETISFSLMAITVVLIIILLLLNGIFSFRLWKPFFRTIDKIKHYDLNENQIIELPAVKTKEFATLNKEIYKMTEKIRKNYIQLRAFTENASHEMQTPLTAILLDTEQLLQNSDLSGGDISRVHNVYNTALRLSKINETLLLLAKIGNHQFPLSTVDFAKIVTDKLGQFQEIIAYKKIEVSLDIKETLQIQMNSELADVFIGNLVSNAIKHNIENGQLQILLNKNSLTITNTGKPLLIPPYELFERFKKNDQSSQSPGLGLAIVKQIAELYKIKVNYSYSELNHSVAVEIV
jgi:signal transduction histidine kinase